jgi:hypothetical protein
VGFERRMDMKSMIKNDEENLLFIDYYHKKPFEYFSAFHLFRASLEPSYNVYYIYRFGYNLLNFNFEGLSDENRWTPKFLTSEISLCKGLCLNVFFKNEVDLNYFKDTNYNFYYDFPYYFSIGTNYFEFIFVSRNIRYILKLNFSLHSLNAHLYVDENLRIYSDYEIYIGKEIMNNLKFIIGIFKNQELNFENLFAGFLIQ